MRPVYLISLALSVVGPIATAAMAAAPQVKFTSKQLTPKTVKAGASVLASVKIATKGGATVSGVSLRFVGAGQVYPVYAMALGSGGRWSKRFTAPVNYGKTNLSLQVWADAQTSLGIRSVKIGQLKVRPTPVDPNAPPPPPPI
jgi:hypothetical protein